MLKSIINKIWKSEGQEEISTPSNANAEFLLMYKSLPIGMLKVVNGTWYFTYSEEFRKQSEILALVDFPNTNQKYESTQLWPFFSYRIPGLNQPSVQEIISKKHIDKNNEVELLKHFGKFSIYNPYQLTPAS